MTTTYLGETKTFFNTLDVKMFFSFFPGIARFMIIEDPL